jgi:hypothetical protein
MMIVPLISALPAEMFSDPTVLGTSPTDSHWKLSLPTTFLTGE